MSDTLPKRIIKLPEGAPEGVPLSPTPHEFGPMASSVAALGHKTRGLRAAAGHLFVLSAPFSFNV